MRQSMSRFYTVKTITNKKSIEIPVSANGNMDQKIMWKKSFRRVPEPLLKKVQTFKDKSVSVACTKAIKHSDVIEGIYEHVGISWDNNNMSLIFQDRIFPNPAIGRSSLLNADGKEIVRKDLPMTTKTFTWVTPNYGDSYCGYHDVSRNREVYQRDFLAPKGLGLIIELLDTQSINNEKVYIFKFVVDEVMDRKDKDFEADLLYALNLLQENVGNSDVFPSDATRKDYIRTVVVEWEILPPGNRDETIDKILTKYRKISPEERDRIEDRYDFLAKFSPDAYVSGTSGFQRYFGAKFRDDLVVFENLRYGNAIYVMYQNWEKLSQKSRLELLKGTQNDFDRIVHSEKWKERLQNVLNDKLQ
jgi:hypothetical protein